MHAAPVGTAATHLLVLALVAVEVSQVIQTRGEVEGVVGQRARALEHHARTVERLLRLLEFAQVCVRLACARQHGCQPLPRVDRG